MSEVKVNKISPRSGTNVQLGDSGDTITVPSGATLDASNATTTLPANVVTTTGSQTLTNKIIGSSQLTGALPALDGSALTGIPDTIAPTRHSIRPSLNLDFANSKALDPRITFTRASNATYYDGYTSVKAEENGIYPSTNLSSSPQSSGVTLTHNVSGISAPDGTQTASYFVPSASSGPIHYSRASGGISSPSLNTPYTGSFFAKANGYDFVVVQLTSGTSSGGSRYAITVDLTNGTIGGYIDTENVSNVSSTATSVGNGWYRITLTASFNTANSSPLATLYIVGAYSDNLSSVNPATTSNATPSFTGDGSSGVYVWGFQVEQRDSVTAYTPTTTAPITKYQPALQTAGNNVARFDHNPTTGESLGLLIEESRTNLLTYSEDFSNATWSKTNLNVNTNTIIAPDGTLTGSKFYENTTTGEHLVDNSLSYSAGSYSFSVYAKAGEYNEIIVRPVHVGANEGNSTTIIFTLTGNGSFNYTPAYGSCSIDNVGNGWYRCVVNLNLTGTVTQFGHRIQLVNVANIYTGDGYSGVYVWGAQAEAGSFPTSYIKTTGSQVTRSRDLPKIPIADWFDYSNGSFYVEYTGKNELGGVVNPNYDGTDTNSSTLLYVGTNFNNCGAFYQDLTGTQTVRLSPNSSNKTNETFVKSAISFDTNEVYLSHEGTTGSAYSFSGFDFKRVTFIRIGYRQSYAEMLNGSIKKLSYYPTKLTANELTDLTEE